MCRAISCCSTCGAADEQTLRFFSLLIGLLALAVTYRVGRQWLSAEAGLAAQPSSSRFPRCASSIDLIVNYPPDDMPIYSVRPDRRKLPCRHPV
jgi:hypothetical protein